MATITATNIDEGSMLDAMIRLALRYRQIVVVLSLGALLYGGYAASTLPIDVFPDLDRPRVTVMTECGELPPDDVEAMVTQPLENALLGTSGVQNVRSQSGAGLSAIHVEFDWGTDIRSARLIVQERLATVMPDLPPGIRPQLAPIASIMGQIMVAGLYRREGPKGGELAPVNGEGLWVERIGGDNPKLLAWRPHDRHDLTTWEELPLRNARWLPENGQGERRVKVEIAGHKREVTFLSPDKQLLELRTLADWVVRPRLLKTTGLAQVVTVGGGRKQYQVLVDPTALHEYDVSLHDVEQALRNNNVNATGGQISQGDFEKPIRVLARLGPRPENVLADLRKIPVKPTPQRTVLLEQVARVTEGAAIKRGDASVNGHAGVILIVTKQPHVDTRDLTDRAVAAIREVESSLPLDVAINPDLYQMRGFIDRGVYNVGEALAIGAALVLIVLFLFLLNFRTTFISLMAIPLSLAITALVFKLVGAITGATLSINVMTLGGIAVAMGELVDDAIVDVENIFRRLRQNAASPDPRSPLRVILAASIEVRSAIVFSTALVILVFLPLFALSGIEGRLFTPLGVAYVVSILASLLVSLSVTPVLSYYLLANSQAVRHPGDGWLLRGLKWLAGYLVRFSMRFAAPLLVVTWVLVGFSVLILSQLGADFLPPFDEGAVQVNVTLPAGSSLSASNQTAALVDAKFRQMQMTASNLNGELLHFVRRSGRAELDEHADPPNVTEYIVTANPNAGRSRDEILKQIMAELKEEIPGVDVEVEQPLAHLMSEMLSGVTAQIAIKLYGDNLDTLQRSAEEIKAAIQDVPGIASLAIEPLRPVDELQIRPRPDDLAFHGVDRSQVAEFVQTALRGEVVSQVQEGQRRFDLLVRLEEPYRSDTTQLHRLRLDLPNGRGQVMLGELADVGDGVGPNQVKRENVRRRLVIRCNALGRDLESVVNDIQTRVRKRVTLPEGYFVEYGGQFESQRRATLLISVLAAISAFGMFAVLLLLFPSVRVVLQILNAIPTAFIGGVAALALTGQTLTVAGMVGFVSLGGIAARNGILLVTHYAHLMKYEGESFTREMILRGSLERLSPVLMTALTAGIGLVPLVLGGHQPGREILYPVATVILGGLITSTFCEFLIHPGLFWRFSGKDTDKLIRKNDETL